MVAEAPSPLLVFSDDALAGEGGSESNNFDKVHLHGQHEQREGEGKGERHYYQEEKGEGEAHGG